MGGAIRETGGAKDETDGADQRKYSPGENTAVLKKHIKHKFLVPCEFFN